MRRSLSQSTSYDGSVDKEAKKGTIRRERAKKLKGTAGSGTGSRGGSRSGSRGGPRTGSRGGSSGPTPELVYHYCPQCMFTPLIQDNISYIIIYYKLE